MSEPASIVRPDVDFTITDPSDALYDSTVDHPTINARFEQGIRNMDEPSKELHRRIRREKRELSARHDREIQEHVARQAPNKAETVSEFGLAAQKLHRSEVYMAALDMVSKGLVNGDTRASDLTSLALDGARSALWQLDQQERDD